MYEFINYISIFYSSYRIYHFEFLKFRYTAIKEIFKNMSLIKIITDI